MTIRACTNLSVAHFENNSQLTIFILTAGAWCPTGNEFNGDTQARYSDQV